VIRNLVIPWIFGAVISAAAADDLIRFTNGDQLHGTLEGMKDGPQVIWKRNDGAALADFKTSEIRHVVLHGGRPLRSLASLSYVALVNGDKIPGAVTDMDGETITVDTSCAGPLKIPRDQVAMLAPSPLGGRVHYHGPFIEDEWRMANAAFPDGLPPVSQEKAKDQFGRWVFSGSAWYWPSKLSGTALLRENAMPDRSILRFDLAWKNRLSIAVGFHADFVKPKLAEEVDKDAGNLPRRAMGFAPGDSSIFPVIFGNSYILQVFSTHLMLFRTSVNDAGAPTVERVQINGNSIRLGDTGKATLEIRSNRLTGEIVLFINGEFVVQWSEGRTGVRDPSSYAGKGNGFGFVVQTEDSPVKISDVIVAEWNGMPDSARSLQVEDQDIVLLANGTDRFSGKIGGFGEGKFSLDGRYGRFYFPLEDVAEIRFARDRQAKETVSTAGDVMIRLSPLGQISGHPLSGSAEALRILNPACGEMNLSLKSAVMLDFEKSNNIIDDWDAEF
jgi:hypothetical protein